MYNEKKNETENSEIHQHWVGEEDMAPKEVRRHIQKGQKRTRRGGHESQRIEGISGQLCYLY